MKRTLYLILLVSLSLFSLLVAVEKNAFDMGQYRINILENDIEEETGKETFELMDIYYNLIDYLKDKADEGILKSNFNEKEIQHMEDVKELFRIGFILKYVSIIFSLATIIILSKIESIERLGSVIFKGLMVNWILLGLLAVLIYFDFNKYFTYFHEIFFTNDLWILDPRTDLLIQMLPEKFFNSMAIDIGVSFLKNLATIQGIGYITSKKGKLEDEKGFRLFKRQKQE